MSARRASVGVGGVGAEGALGPRWPWGLSLLVHAAIVALGAWLAYARLRTDEAPTAPEPPPQALMLTVELPQVAEGTLLAESGPDPTGDPPRTAGGGDIARIDTGHDGHGGDVTSDSPAIHLGDTDDGMRRSPDMTSTLVRDQEQRLRTAKERASREDRRATTHPTELTFLATGQGERPERREKSARDPSRGELESPEASARGGELGAPEQTRGEDGERQDVGGDHEGASFSAPGLGVRDGRVGTDHRAGANVGRGRPQVAQGPVAVEASKAGRPNDTIDSEQKVALAVQSLVHASTAGGLAGAGHGGSGGGGDPGAGGEGVGSHPRPLGDGGEWYDLNTTDPRFLPYFRHIHAKVDPLWADAFPKSAVAELKQGTVILELTIFADGTSKVAWPPLRPSGIDEFDQNCADALRRASPFHPLPKELGVTQLKVRAPFRATRRW